MGGINDLQKELEAGLADLRFMIADLEPTATLGSFGLFAGLRRYLEKFSEQTGIESNYQLHTVVEHLPDIIEIAIFPSCTRKLAKHSLSCASNQSRRY